MNAASRCVHTLSFFRIDCVKQLCFKQSVGNKFLMRSWPGQAQLDNYEKVYPEVDPHSFYTHICMRMAAAMMGDAVDHFLGKYEMSSGRYIVLMSLELAPEGSKPSKLALEIGVTQATITGLIDGLEKTGFVNRKDHHEDGRACVVALTEMGRNFMSTVRPAFNKWVGELYSVWTLDEQKQVVELLKKLTKKVQAQPLSPA